MEMNVLQVSALVMGLGSILFLAAAFSPISRVFGERYSARRLEIIMASRSAWTVTQWLFAVGAAVTVVGVGIAALDFRLQPSIPLWTAAVGGLFVGALLWSWHVYLRAVDPAAFTSASFPVWHFAAYTLLTQAGLAVFGLVLLQSDLPSWLGWLTIGSMGTFFVLTLIFRDMPPFVYYVITTIVAVALYRA